MVCELVLVLSTELKLADILYISLQRMSLLLQSSLDLIQTLLALSDLLLSQLMQILLHANLLRLDPGAQALSELPSLHLDQTLAVLWLDDVLYKGVPFAKPVEMELDALEVGVLLLELLKVEALVKVVNITALFELVYSNLEALKVSDDAPLDSSLGSLICVRAIDDVPEPGTTVADQSVNELMEVWMADDSDDLLRHGLHVAKELLELADELTLGWLEGHAVTLCVIVNSSLDAVLLLVFVHLEEDEIGTLLIDLDLSLHHHVVDQSDEGAQAVIVSFGQLEDSVLQLIFLLLEDH